MEILDDNFKNLFEYIKMDKRKFDFFDIIPPKEVLVSKWVEFILNPQENGVGNLPVSKLLELVNKDINLDELEFQSIDTEVSTSNLRRIDIFIKYKGLWIVIENKIESYENNEQTNDYYKYVEAIKGNNEVVYIYLKPNYNNSIPRSNAFKIVNYNDFIEKLKTISEFDYTEKDKYKYLKEFIISGGRFMKDQEMEITDSLKFYINNIDKFEAITNEYKDKNKRLFNLIATSVVDALNEEEVKYQATKSVVNYIQFYKSNWKNENHTGAHFEVLFKIPFSSPNILGKRIDADIVLHMEHTLKENDLLNFESKGITKKSSQAYYNGEPIKETVTFDFTNSAGINESINMIIDVMKKYRDRYGDIIDRALM